MSQPAWHPDPWRSYPLRWWDGDQWTEHVRSSTGQGSAPIPLEDIVQPVRPGTVLFSEPVLKIVSTRGKGNFSIATAADISVGSVSRTGSGSRAISHVFDSLNQVVLSILVSKGLAKRTFTIVQPQTENRPIAQLLTQFGSSNLDFVVADGTSVGVLRRQGKRYLAQDTNGVIVATITKTSSGLSPGGPYLMQRHLYLDPDTGPLPALALGSAVVLGLIAQEESDAASLSLLGLS